MRQQTDAMVRSEAEQLRQDELMQPFAEEPAGETEIRAYMVTHDA